MRRESSKDKVKWGVRATVRSGEDKVKWMWITSKISTVV